MFTLEQIKSAHSLVKSGADFPAYIRTIKQLGVSHYETFVADGHIDYHGANDFSVTVPAKYDLMSIAEIPQMEVFKSELIVHQQGKTDFLTFIQMCSSTGIEKWAIDMDQMTCTYFDKARNEVLVEKIPE